AFFEPTPVYSVDVLVLLFDVHHGDVAVAVKPQPFTSDESVIGALTAELSEINGYRLYATSEPAAFAPATLTLRPTTSNPKATMRPRTPLDMLSTPSRLTTRREYGGARRFGLDRRLDLPVGRPRFAVDSFARLRPTCRLRRR